MLNPSRLSSLISSTSFPLNRCRPSSGSQSWGYTTRLRGWGIFNRHYGDFCTGADTSRVRAILERHFGRNPADFDRRTDGESCLFAIQITAEGRALLDTFTLASCAWATGRLEDPGPKSTGWLDGFEA